MFSYVACFVCFFIFDRKESLEIGQIHPPCSVGAKACGSNDGVKVKVDRLLLWWLTGPSGRRVKELCGASGAVGGEEEWAGAAAVAEVWRFGHCAGLSRLLLMQLNQVHCSVTFSHLNKYQDASVLREKSFCESLCTAVILAEDLLVYPTTPLCRSDA